MPSSRLVRLGLAVATVAGALAVAVPASADPGPNPTCRLRTREVVLVGDPEVSVFVPAVECYY